MLTKSGTELLEHARSMSDIAQKLALTATGKSLQIEGSVVVSAGELDAVFRLPKIIAVIRREEPGIEIEVVVTNETSDLKRCPYPLSTMICIHSMQHWYYMDVTAMEDVLYEITSMCLFAHLSLDNPISNHTTIMNFRHLLDKEKLSCQFIKNVHRWLTDAIIYFKEGTIADATIIETASSTKNNAIARSPELHLTEKGKPWFLGLKAHIDMDVRTGLTHNLNTTAVNVHDITEKKSCFMAREELFRWIQAIEAH